MPITKSSRVSQPNREVVMAGMHRILSPRAELVCVQTDTARKCRSARHPLAQRHYPMV